MPNQVRASHILLMYKGSERSTAARTKAEAQMEIEELKTELAAGSDFAKLATDCSDCPSGRSGGDLGTFGRGQMVPAFDAAVFGMDVGAISGVVETAFGYHLIKRTE